MWTLLLKLLGVSGMPRYEIDELSLGETNFKWDNLVKNKMHGA